VSPPPSRRRGAARLAPAWLTAVLAVGSSLVAAGEPPPPSVADDGAASAAHGTTTAARDAPPLASLPDYLAAFAEAYTTPSAERAALAAAREALVSAELDMAPRLSLRERLDLAASGPELELGVHLEVPLFDATAAPRTAVAAADVELRNLYAAASREAALAAFLHDLAALAVLSPAADAAARWLPGPEPVGVQATEPLRLPPDERVGYEAALRAREAAVWLAGVREDVAARLRRALGRDAPATGPLGGGVPGSTLAASSAGAPEAAGNPAVVGPRASLSPPDVAELEAVLVAAYALGDRAGDGTGRSLEEAVDACLDGSTAVLVARARHDHALRVAASDEALDLRVALTGSLENDAVLGAPVGVPGSPGTGTTGSIAVAALLVLPAGWPIGGSLGAEVGTAGVSQELQLSWPPGRSVPTPLDDPDEQLDEELALAADDARAYLRALRAARAERARSERALAWTLLDAAPRLPVADAKRLASTPWAPDWPHFAPPDDLALAELRLEAALGRLGELAAAIDVARHCGLLPAAGAGSRP
jgi:hypothetical protein